MSDDSFIREVDDELRHDQARDFWNRYRNWIIAAAVGVVLATAGYRGWEYYSKSIAAQSGDRFMEAVKLSNEGNHDQAIKKLEALESDGSGQYPALAKLRIASELASRGDVKNAIESYDKISVDTSFNETFRSIAQLRAGLLAVDSMALEEADNRLQVLAAAGLPFRHSAREGLGLANFKAGKFQEALKWFDAIVNDSESGANIRGRANIMLGLLSGKGIATQPAR